MSLRRDRLRFMIAHVESLDDEEFDALLRAVDIRRRVGTGKAPTDTELNLVEEGTLSLAEVVKNYRNRVGGTESLADAMAIIEQASFQTKTKIAWDPNGNQFGILHDPHPTLPNLVAEEIDLVKQGKFINAIKGYRERAGTGLKESKEKVECWAYENGYCHYPQKPASYLGPTVPQANAPPSLIPPPTPSPAWASLDVTPGFILAEMPDLSGVEKDFCKNHQPINAIKEYRARTGALLKVAKDKIDEYRKKMGLI